MTRTQYPNSFEYIRSALALQESQHGYNEDRSFAERPEKNAQIIYLFDTNVCEAYLKPDENSMAGSYAVRNLFLKATQRTVDRLTARFLFEGKLPGQSEKIYLSPPHWNEMLHRATTIIQAAAGSANSMPEIPADLLERLRRLKGDPEALVQVAIESGISEHLQKLARAASIGQRVQTLLGDAQGGNSRVASFEYTDYWGRVENSIRRIDIKFWHDAILNAKRKKAAGRSNTAATKLTDEQVANAERDAVAIASFQALYRSHPSARGQDADLRFLFVTTDIVLMDVLKSKYESVLQPEGIPQFGRLPARYFPIINYEYVHQQLFHGGRFHDDSDAIVNEIREAVRTAHPFDSIHVSRDAIRNSDLNFGDSVDRWSKIASMMAVIGNEYFQDGLSERNRELRVLTSLFEHDNIASAAASLLQVAAAGINTDHVQQGAGLALGRLADKLVERDVNFSQGAEIRRAPLRYFGIEILRPLSFEADAFQRTPRSLDEFLDQLGAGGEHGVSSSVARSAIRALREAWNDREHLAETYLLAAAIYFSVGAWGSARRCASLATKTMSTMKQHKNPVAREARYAEALALRMTMVTKSDYEAARRLLMSNLAKFSDMLPKWRDQIELFALDFTACVVQAIENVDPFQNYGENNTALSYIEAATLPSTFTEAMLETNEAIDRISEYISDGKDTSGVALRMLVQARTNKLGASIFDYLLRISEDHPKVGDLVQYRRDLESEYRLADLSLSFAAKTYIASARVLELRTRDSLVELNKVFRDAERSHVDLCSNDKLEQEYLRARLKNIVGPKASS